MGAEIPDGAVLVARAILNSSLWTMSTSDRILAITCICIANWRERKLWAEGKGEITVKRGQFVRSWSQLSKDSCLTIKQVRNSCNRLIRAGFLARERAGRFSVYTIPKYEHYQTLAKYSDSVDPESGKNLGKITGSIRAGCGQDVGRVISEQEGKKGRREEENKESPVSSVPLPTKDGGNGDGHDHLQKAKMKADLFKEDATKTKVHEYIGYLVEQGTVPKERIREMVDKLWNLRESLVMDNGTPVDKIFRHAIDQAIKYKAAGVSYVGTVIRDSVMKWRDGVLKI